MCNRNQFFIQVKSMIEELKQWWKQFSLKWWLMYYQERRKNKKYLSHIEDSKNEKGNKK